MVPGRRVNHSFGPNQKEDEMSVTTVRQKVKEESVDNALAANA
jgi:hypothetical protein